METMTETGTEKRVDELSKRVDFGFEQVDHRFVQFEKRVDRSFEEVDRRFERLEIRVDRGFEEVDHRFDRVEADLREMRGRFEKVDHEFTAVRAEVKAGFDSMSRQMTRFFAGTLGSIVAGVIVLIASHH
jgi:tetrahydromethanopterin S-methyltransferase subunit G